MIKNIIFDLGRVLLEYNPDQYLIDLGYTEEQRQKLLSAVFKTKEWLLLDRGTITEPEAIRIWKQRNPDLKADIELIMDNWESILTIKPDTLNLVEELAADYQLFVISNFHLKAYHYLKEKHDFFSNFDGIVISAEINSIKPELEIYQYLLATYSLNPAECIFIDDSAQNISAAEEVGIKAIQFTNAAALRTDLNLYLKK